MASSRLECAEAGGGEVVGHAYLEFFPVDACHKGKCIIYTVRDAAPYGILVVEQTGDVGLECGEIGSFDECRRFQFE